MSFLIEKYICNFFIIHESGCSTTETVRCVVILKNNVPISVWRTYKFTSEIKHLSALSLFILLLYYCSLNCFRRGVYFYTIWTFFTCLRRATYFFLWTLKRKFSHQGCPQGVNTDLGFKSTHIISKHGRTRVFNKVRQPADFSRRKNDAIFFCLFHKRQQLSPWDIPADFSSIAWRLIRWLFLQNGNELGEIDCCAICIELFKPADVVRLLPCRWVMMLNVNKSSN